MKGICILLMLIFSSAALFAQQKQVYDKVVEAADLDQYKTYYWGSDFAKNDSQGQANQQQDIQRDQMKSEEMQQDLKTDDGAREADELMPDADTTNLNVQMPEEQARANQELNEATHNMEDKTASARHDAQEEREAEADNTEATIETAEEEMGQAAEDVQAQATQVEGKMSENNQMKNKMIKNAIEYEFDVLGYDLEQNNPDLIINFTVFDKKYNEENGYNKAAYKIDADITTNDPSILSQLEDGTLIISAVDRKKGKNIWIGYVPEAFDPNSDLRQQRQSIRQAVSAAIETFAARTNFENAPFSRTNDGNGDN